MKRANKWEELQNLKEYIADGISLSVKQDRMTNITAINEFTEEMVTPLLGEDLTKKELADIMESFAELLRKQDTILFRDTCKKLKSSVNNLRGA